MRNALWIGGLVVVALAIALYLAMKKDSDAARGEGATEPAPSKQEAVAPPRTSTPSVTPGLTEAPHMPQAGAGENPKDYVVGDIHVRDHREGDNKPLDIPPNVHPAEGPAIPSLLTHEISQKVKTVVLDCAKAIPKEARTDERPRVEGQVIIAIKDHNVTVTKSTMQIRNVTGESVEPTKQCIETKTIGITNPAADQADLDSYSINVTYAIP
jgi:hypothetical protein